MGDQFAIVRSIQSHSSTACPANRPYHSSSWKHEWQRKYREYRGPELRWKPGLIKFRSNQRLVRQCAAARQLISSRLPGHTNCHWRRRCRRCHWLHGTHVLRRKAIPSTKCSGSNGPSSSFASLLDNRTAGCLPALCPKLSV
jgi:hypothetical protein